MRKSRRLKLLTNAEPFGFGPTSAVADCFPQFREKFSSLSYIGSSHTLDLQAMLPYSEIYRLEGNQSQMDERFKKTVREFDGFFTALDFHNAELAVEAGVPTVVYDPLTWFWKSLPPVLSSSHLLYLAQGFHGVRETLENKKASIQNVQIVPPIVRRNESSRTKLSQEKTLVMLNLGGLMNPFWSLDHCIQYAATIIEAVLTGLKGKYDLVVLGNRNLEKALPSYSIRTCSREEIKEILPNVRLSIATSGLGNIYESAAYSIPTLFLPPPGDSHGQQLHLLARNGEVDESIDWRDLDEGAAVDYRAEPDQVMQKISRNVESIHASKALQGHFSRLIQEKCAALLTLSNSKTTKLLDQFGQDGTEAVAEQTYEFVNSKRIQNSKEEEL